MDLMTLALTSKIMGGSGGSGGGEEFPADRYFEGGYAEVNLPNATKIKQYSFYSDSKLVNITMPNVTYIGDNAFRNCGKLAIDSIPSGVTYIGYESFYYCSAITSLTINGPTYIYSRSFNTCQNLKTLIFNGEGCKLGGYTFSNCAALETVTFNAVPTSIDANAFAYNSNLTTINVPWAEGEVANAPWGATNATINYNYTGG